MIAFIMTFARNGANGAQPVSPKLLKIEVKGLQRQIHEQELPAENIERFVQRVKRNRHDRNHACSKKYEYYCLTGRGIGPCLFHGLLPRKRTAHQYLSSISFVCASSSSSARARMAERSAGSVSANSRRILADAAAWLSSALLSSASDTNFCSSPKSPE